jgi:hypothetical protein
MAEKGEVRHAETTPLRAREFRSDGINATGGRVDAGVTEFRHHLQILIAPGGDGGTLTRR